MPERQAEVLADRQLRLIEADLATRADIKALEAATKSDELIRRNMKALEHRVTATILKWMFGALAGQTVLIITVVQQIVTSALPPVQ